MLDGNQWRVGIIVAPTICWALLSRLLGGFACVKAIALLPLTAVVYYDLTLEELGLTVPATVIAFPNSNRVNFINPKFSN